MTNTNATPTPAELRDGSGAPPTVVRVCAESSAKSTPATVSPR